MRSISDSSPWVLSALVVLSSGVLGCNESPPGSSYAVRDSSGIAVVESQGPAWGVGTGWSLSAEPSLQIGMREGEEVFQFFDVADGLQLPDGRIVILNAGTQTVRVFSSEGEFLTEFGGAGDGPGEFRRMRSVHHLGADTLLIWDPRRPGYSLFAASGAFLGSTTLIRPGSAQLFAVFPAADGRLIVKTYASPVSQGGDRGIGIHRDMAPVLVFDRKGALLDTLGVYPSTETMIMRLGPGTGVGPAPFPKSTLLAVADTTVFLGTADEMEVSVLDLDGALKAVFRYPDVALAVQEEDREWYRAQLTEMARTPEEQQMLGVVFSGLIFPETKAAYSDLVVDPAGAIWLRTGRHFPPIGPSAEWTVFSERGFVLGTVNFPERFEPLEFGVDHVLGVWKDEMDVEFVRLYPILKRDPE